MTTQALQDLLDDGFALVPVLRDSKRPEHADWPTRTFALADIDGNRHNIGVKCGAPSNGKVDVDLDAAEAVACADLLPFTRIHGRPGKPHSHHWYLCPDLKATLQFKDPVSGAMLVELRGTGGQTVVPPSTHPSGDVLAWENRSPFLAMAATDLQRAVAEVATVALFARYWPTGSRHVAALHIGGFLARLGIDAAHVERMVRLMATIAGDEEVKNRTDAARQSAEKHQQGGKTTGGPSLTEHFQQGGALVKAVYGWFGREGDDEIEELNKTYFVTRMGTSTVVGAEEGETVNYLSFQAFKDWHCNRKLGKQPLGDAWLRHPNRRAYTGVVFAPPGCRRPALPTEFNQWRGFAYTPDESPTAASRLPRYLEHVYDVIANYNTHHADYVLDLMADTVQQPGRLIGKTLALRGAFGVGKSIFVEPFGHLFGRHFITVNSKEQLVGAFNGHLSSKVVIFAEEAIWGGNKGDVGTLKRLITQDTLTVRRLYVDATTEVNCCHLWMATNDKWVYPAGNQERRLVVLDVAPQRSTEYYRKLAAEIATPGFHEALLGYLLARPVDEMRLRVGLDTKALAELKDMSSDAIQQWWRQVLDEGSLFEGELEWPDFLPTSPLYERFVNDMGHKHAGHGNLGTRMSFSKRLKELLPGHPDSTQRTVRIQGNARQERGYALPSLTDCRKEYDRMTGSVHDWCHVDTDPPVLEEVPF